VSQDRSQAIREIAREAARHLAWLKEEGVTDVPRPEPRRTTAAPEAAGGARTAPGEPGTSLPLPRTPKSPAPGAATPPGAATYTLDHKGCGSPPLLAVRSDLGECTRCKLGPTRRTLVFGVGNPQAELVFVGEGPGADEDAQGEPFVGRAGQLLTKMIEAMGYRREQVYIANVVKCRPPQNRPPEPDEIEACEPYLRRQIEAIRPKVIVALGKFAAQTLLATSIPITKLRGTWSTYQGVRLMPTFHPAYLLRSPDEKQKAWADLKLVMAELGASPGPTKTTMPPKVK
jgi:uracil-DNA glycosylase